MYNVLVDQVEEKKVVRQNSQVFVMCSVAMSNGVLM